jgi:hypothetical protein
VSYLPFWEVFTNVTSLCKRARILALQKYKSVPQRSVFVDLSGTTKLLKKMPKHVCQRLQKIKVRLG